MGNLTRDPDLKFTKAGTGVTEVGLAINRRWANDDGDQKEETTFVDVTFWGKHAETIAKYVKKGHPLYIEGRLQIDSWDDKETGAKRYKLRVIGDGFQFLTSKSSDQSGISESRSTQPKGDIPF